MQIKITGQAIPASKAETDRREEVKKIKPIGSQKIPDSFEGDKAVPPEGYPTDGCYASPEGHVPAEPKMKADQITDEIFFRQMTAARIGESGNPRMKPKAEDNSADSSSSKNIQSEENKKQKELQNHFTEFQHPTFYK